jgi:hypothetical protein
LAEQCAAEYPACGESGGRIIPGKVAERIYLMKIKLGAAALLFLIFQSCSVGGSQRSRDYTLPSGKKIKIENISQVTFPKSNETGLVMKYETGISITDKEALRREVDEVWTIFVKDVETAGLNFAAIRAINYGGGTIVRRGKGYGYVFKKDSEGKWRCTQDDNGSAQTPAPQ